MKIFKKKKDEFLESSPSQTIDDKKSDLCSEGKDIKRSIFGVSQKRRTTRAERMACYAEEYKRTFDL